MKVYRYRKLIVTFCVLLGIPPFVTAFIVYSGPHPVLEIDKKGVIWFFVLCLVSIGIALAVLVGRKIIWDNGILYHYYGDRMVWKAEIQYGQAYARMLVGHKIGRFIWLIYVADEKICKRTISRCDYIEDLYIELCKYNDPNMTERYPVEFKMFKYFREVPYEEIAQSMKEYKGN